MCQFDPSAKVRLGRTPLDHYEAKRTRASLCHMLVDACSNDSCGGVCTG